MMMGKEKEVVMRVVMVAVVVLTCAECRKPVLYKVGGGSCWREDVNYTLWSNNHTFYAGDWLLFVFEKTRYNVLQVNGTSYGNCTDQGFIKNVTKGGRDVFQLADPQPYYFLSSGGYCFQGMRLAVNVSDAPPPSPAPTPSKSGSTSNIKDGRSWTILTIVVAVNALMPRVLIDL